MRQQLAGTNAEECREADLSRISGVSEAGESDKADCRDFSEPFNMIQGHNWSLDSLVYSVHDQNDATV